MGVRLRLCAWLAALDCAGHAAAVGVIELTDATFEEKIATGDWFVEFYAPWCGHCKKLEPVWEKLAARLSRESSHVRVAKVDATREKLTAYRFDVRGFPSLFMLSGGFMKRHSGARTEEKLYAWATEGHSKARLEPIPGPPGIVGNLLIGIEAMLSQLDAPLRSFVMSANLRPWITRLREILTKMPRIVSDKDTIEAIMLPIMALIISTVAAGFLSCLCALCVFGPCCDARRWFPGAYQEAKEKAE